MIEFHGSAMEQEFLLVESVLPEEEGVFEEDCSRVAEFIGDLFEELVRKNEECFHEKGTESNCNLVPFLPHPRPLS